MCEERGVKNWCGMVKEILHKCGFDSLWQRNQVDGLSAKEFKSMVECCLYRLERIKWLQEVEEKEKQVLYKHKIGFCWRSLCAKCCKIFISKCVSTITRRNFATDARVRKVQKTKNASL